MASADLSRPNSCPLFKASPDREDITAADIYGHPQFQPAALLLQRVIVGQETKEAIWQAPDTTKRAPQPCPCAKPEYLGAYYQLFSKTSTI